MKTNAERRQPVMVWLGPLSAQEPRGQEKVGSRPSPATAEPNIQEKLTAALLGEIERWRGAGSAQDDISILPVEVSAAAGRGEPGVANQTGGCL